MSRIDNIEKEVEALAWVMIFYGISPDEVIQPLKLNYAAQLEENAERVRKSA